MQGDEQSWISKSAQRLFVDGISYARDLMLGCGGVEPGLGLGLLLETPGSLVCLVRGKQMHGVCMHVHADILFHVCVCTLRLA